MFVALLMILMAAEFTRRRLGSRMIPKSWAFVDCAWRVEARRIMMRRCRANKTLLCYNASEEGRRQKVIACPPLRWPMAAPQLLRDYEFLACFDFVGVG